MTQEGVPYWYPEHKEKPMKYKIDPIPGMPSWFVPGIVCRVRDVENDEWLSISQRKIIGYTDRSEYHFVDSALSAWRFAEPVEQWEPQEGEWVAAWDDNDRSYIGYRVLEFGTGIHFDHYARLQYPDGRVIDCACDVEELKGRTDWI